MKTTNTPQVQTEQDQTSDHKIKFHHAENGSIDIFTGQTVYSDLFMFGAFALTKKHKYTTETAFSEYQTDLDGLKILESKIGEGISLISDSITSLGLVMAEIDKSALADNDLNGCYWLVAGLGELIGQLSREHSDITHSLRVLSTKSSGETK